MASSKLLPITQEKEGGGGKGREGSANVFGPETELSKYNYGYRIYIFFNKSLQVQKQFGLNSQAEGFC